MNASVLHELAAREAIRQQLHNYCRSMDRRDDELGYAVWHPGGTAEYLPGVFSGLGRDFVDRVSQSHLRRTVHSHQIATVGIEVNGELAASEAYATVRLRTNGEDAAREEFFAGRYLDRWSLRDGVWAIDHRLWVLDFDGLSDDVHPNLPITSRRDRNDPSYALLASIRG